MKQVVSIFFIVLTSIFVVKSQEVQFTVSAPKVVAMGEQFQLTYTLNKKGSNLQVPPFKGFTVLYGPNTSSSTSVQIINGKMTQNVSYTYTYVLQASEEGKFELPPASVKVGRKEYNSNALNIEVVKGSKPSQQQRSQPGSQQVRPQQSGQIGKDDLFVKVLVNKSKLYQGEHLIATIKIYSRVDLTGFSEVKFPSYNGFWTQDVENPGQISLQRENYNGQIYNVGLFKKTLLYPQRSGEIQIEPFEIECQVRQTVQRRSRSIFDDFFGSYQTLNKKLVSNPITITVLDLPANKPESFDGAVGELNFTAALDNNKVKANEAITLKLTVNGSGNLKLINPLKIDFPPDFEAYDPKTSSSIKNTLNGQVGSKSFEYLIIPRFAGTFRLAPIEFSYFDTRSKSYKTIKTKEFIINVEKGEEAENVAVVSGFTKEDVKYIGSDILYIKTSPFLLSKRGEFLFGTMKFWLTYIIAIVLFIAIIIIRREQIKKNANMLRVKNRRAGKLSKKRLKIAKGYLNKQDSNKFYDEVLTAIWGYLSDKLSIPLAELSKDTVFNDDRMHNLEAEIKDELLNVIEQCEFARYAPSAVDTSMEDLYKKTFKLIIKLEQKIR
jgi:hypothetical protein